MGSMKVGQKVMADHHRRLARDAKHLAQPARAGLLELHAIDDALSDGLISRNEAIEMVGLRSIARFDVPLELFEGQIVDQQGVVYYHLPIDETQAV
jgi:hypothetical protein